MHRHAPYSKLEGNEYGWACPGLEFVVKDRIEDNDFVSLAFRIGDAVLTVFAFQ